jgi:hypothetical protein
MGVAMRERRPRGTEGRVLVFGSESVGRGDQILGYEIVVQLLKSLAKRDDRPAAIVCWNTGVKLLTEGSPVIPHLKNLEKEGVAILAGQLCVNELELAGKMAVGKLATMDEILDLILHHEVVNL